MNLQNIPKNQESLYRTMHNSSVGYRENNQGLWTICDWLHLIKDKRGEVYNLWINNSISIVELGCGNGKLCNLLSDIKLDVTGVDIVTSPNVYDRSKYKFIKHDLTEFPYPFGDNEFDYCLSFDVMEHLPEDKVSDVLKEMARISCGIIVKIACHGGPPLHITVKSPGWWFDKLIESCPDLSWRLLRNYERMCRKINGEVYCTDQIIDNQPSEEDDYTVYAPLFYGKKIDEG